MTPLWTLAAITWLGASPPPAHPGADWASRVRGYQTLALMPLSSLGSTDEAAGALGKILTQEFQKILGAKLVTAEALGRQPRHVTRALDQCQGVAACLVEVVGGLGWDGLVVGNVAGLGERRVIHLKLIDVRTGTEIRRAAVKATGEERALIGNIRRAAVELVAPSLYVGVIKFAAPQPDVQIMVDGALVGTTPLANPKKTVPVGRHAIEATSEGLVPFSTMVDVAYGEVKEVTLQLPRSTVFVGGDTPFRYRWWTWVLGGAGALALGLGGYFNYQHLATVDKIEDRARHDRLTSGHADLNDEQVAHWHRAVVCYGVSGGLLASFGVLMTLDFM